MVPHHLELNVACLLNELLYQQCVVTKGRHSLSLGQRDILKQLRLQGRGGGGRMCDWCGVCMDLGGGQAWLYRVAGGHCI